MRAIAYIHAFAFLALYMWEKGYSVWVWSALAAQFLIYPHLAYWRACRATDSQRAELQHLLLDCFLVGIWAGGLGFPPWISFSMFIGTAVNNAISRGNPGIALSIGLLGGGAAAGAVIGGFHFEQQEPPLVILLCILGSAWYLLGIGKVAHTRALKLREVRERLKQREQELKGTNDSLRAQLQENELLQQQLREQANRDPLTGLFNRRYLQATIERELARCRREGHPICLMLIDIDHFKRVNDRFGHQVGDEVLFRLGRLLDAQARKEDLACRYGGEEFLMLLPKMPRDNGLERAAAWCKAFSNEDLRVDGQRVDLTLSIGLAVFPEHAVAAGELVRKADLALYQAKAQGRNGVVVFDGFTS